MRLMLLSENDEISSISGSDSAASDTSDSDSDAHNSKLSHRRSCVDRRQQQQLLLRNSAGQLISIHQCVIDVHQVHMIGCSTVQDVLNKKLSYHRKTNYLLTCECFKLTQIMPYKVIHHKHIHYT